jgi:hypothetical protein
MFTSCIISLCFDHENLVLDPHACTGSLSEHSEAICRLRVNVGVFVYENTLQASY